MEELILEIDKRIKTIWKCAGLYSDYLSVHIAELQVDELVWVKDKIKELPSRMPRPSEQSQDEGEHPQGGGRKDAKCQPEVVGDE